MTQVEIGEVIGISQMQVSRVTRRALERLRRLAEGQTRIAQHDEASA